MTFDLDAILYAVIGIECDILGLDYNHQWELYRHLVGEWIYPLGGSATIVVDPEPDAINAPWSLTGPCSYSYSGNGDNSLSGLDPGDYTIAWGEVSGWQTPSNSTQNVAADETITFGATYTETTPSGTIVIDPSPDALNAPWSLDGPNSYTASGNGDAILQDQEPGDYTITWGSVSGWTTPSNSTQTLNADQTITFSGTYTEEPATGIIVIDPSPDALNAPWSLSGPDSYNASGNGDETLTELAVGDYTITWGAVAGWITPSNSTQTLAADQTITFSGTYVEEGGTGTVTDIDGNVYQTIKIGDQWWMMENLKVTHYRNGDPIPHVTDGSTWGALSTGAYCEYDNNSVNVATYGRLYNWYAVADSRNIAPEGWHVPTDEELKQLEMYLGMSQAEADGTGWRGTDEGGKLKETGTTHWNSPNEGATNESGFTALPGGYRYSGPFYDMGYLAYFWSSSEYSSDYAWFRRLYYNSSQVYRSNDLKPLGFSVRCVRD